MKRIITVIALGITFCNLAGQADQHQVNIESRFMTVNNDFMHELGIDFHAGLNLAHFTNTPKENRVPKPGIDVGVSVEAEPLGGFFIAPGISFTQDGEKYKTEDLITALTRNNIEVNILANPRIIVGDGISVGIAVQPAVYYNINQVGLRITEGEKEKNKIELGDNVNRTGALIRTGITTTIRTDVGDITIGGLYEAGLTKIYKEDDPGRKPSVFSISLIAKLFTRIENARNREELLIFLRPKIIETAE
jgi:type II secretory pathway component GspD/PulD (secretin)